MKNLVIIFSFLLLFPTSIIFSQTGLKGSGDISHLEKKISTYNDSKMGNFKAYNRGITPKALAAAMYEVAVLKDGDKCLPPISEEDYGCVGGGMGRGVEYLFNIFKGIDLSEDNEDSSLGQDVTDEILTDLKGRGLFTTGKGTTGTPEDWKKSKDKVTHKLKRKIGKDVKTEVFDFPNKSGKVTGSFTSSGYSQPENIQEATSMIEKALQSGHAVELRLDNGFGCGGGFHFATAYRVVRFKGFPDLFGITIVDDGKQNGASGQGDGKKENYERGPYIFNKNGNCLNSKGFKITHIVIETLK